MESRNERLLLNLVTEPLAKETARDKVNFITALRQLGIESVFDIVGYSKPEFIERLGAICDADAAAAYDNAMCYAVQIGRLYREQRVSNGQYQHLTRRTGVRALTEIGPSYPNLFKENWDAFCKVGALAAIDSPVAYLRALYHFATRMLETSGQGTQPKILLNTRRPDIATLLLDQHSTFTARPMLEQVNDVLMTDIKAFLPSIPGEQPNRPIYEVLAAQRHPFIFPYHFAHHQCRLGLGEKKLQLGELNYRISFSLPATQGGRNSYGARQTSAQEAQRLLSGLSPAQQKLLIEPSLFTTFYLAKDRLPGGWKGPGTAHLNPHSNLSIGFRILPGQPAVSGVVPPAESFATQNGLINRLTLEFSKPVGPRQELFNVTSTTPNTNVRWTLNYLHGMTNGAMLCPFIQWPGPQAFPVDPGCRASFTIVTSTGPASSPRSLAALSYTIVLDEYPTWTDEQQVFWRSSYGLAADTDSSSSALAELKSFMQQTELNAEQVEALLSQRAHFPRLSPNCPSTNPQKAGGPDKVAFPHSSHYGACYVNGHGCDRYDSLAPGTAESRRRDQFDNSMGLREQRFDERTVWYLTKTSPQRFDRLQRMIRLQRWLDIPFAELDTLIISAIRREGEHNLGMELNGNTLRALGVYRYLSARYRLKPEEFAAFMHDLTPYASGEGIALFDQVFNSVALFDMPLVLDQQPFNAHGSDAASKRTVAQLCAGLGLQPTEVSLLRLCMQTVQYVGPLRRDLATVSSLYRQARIPQLFGLSVQDGCELLQLLGGASHQEVVCSGWLGQPISPLLSELAVTGIAEGDPATPAADILDVLMQLDWAVNWLKDSKQTVSQVRQLLGLTPGDYLPPEGLADRVAKLAEDTRAQVVTDQQIRALNLPTHERATQSRGPGDLIDWRAVLLPLLDAQGLVKALPLEMVDNTQAQLNSALTQALQPLALDDADRTASLEKLATLLLNGHDRQLRLIEGLAQEMVNLPMDRAQVVVAWAGTTAYQLLSSALEVDNRAVSADSLIENLRAVLRHAQAVLHLGLSTSALRVFLARPQWLTGTDSTELSWASLYLLGRYTRWFKRQSQAEEALLGYFIIANPPGIALKNKTLRRTVNALSAEALANLLGWNRQDIERLFRELPLGRAVSMAQVEWVLRCQENGDATGFSASALLDFTALHADSASSTWQGVGEAAVAASR